MLEKRNRIHCPLQHCWLYRNRGLRRLDREGAESSVDFSTMLQWTVNTIGAICGWEMPPGHDLKGVTNGETESCENCAIMAEHLYGSIGTEVSEDLTTRALNRVNTIGAVAGKCFLMSSPVLKCRNGLAASYITELNVVSDEA